MSDWNKFNNVDDIEKVLNAVKKEGFPTGSYFFGYSNHNDYDYIVTDEWYQKLSRRMGYNNIPQRYLYDNNNLEFLHIKLRTKDFHKWTDCIITTPKEYEVWKKATETFIRVIKIKSCFDLYRDKRKRVYFFEELKKYFRNKLGE